MTTPPVPERVAPPVGRGRALLPIFLLVVTAMAVALAAVAILAGTPARTVAIGPAFEGRILVGLPTRGAESEPGHGPRHARPDGARRLQRHGAHRS